MKIIIVGTGNIGTAISASLVTEGHDLVAVDMNADSLAKLSEELDISYVCGSGTDTAILTEAGVADADLLIAVTSNDEVNLLSCLIAKKLGASATICRVRSPQYSSAINLIRDDLSLSMVVSPEREAANEIVRIIENPVAQNVESFMNGRVKLVSLEITEGSPLAGNTVVQIFSKVKAPVLVCAVERDGEAFIPFGSFRFEVGDTVNLISHTTGISDFLSEMGIVSSKIKNVIVIGGGKTAYYLADMLLQRKTRVLIVETDPERADELTELLPKAEVICGDGSDYNLLREEGVDKTDALCCLTGIDEKNVLTSLFAKNHIPGIKTITKITSEEIERTARPLDLGSVIAPGDLCANLVLSYVRALQNSIGSNVKTLHRLCSDKVEALEFKVSQKSSLTGIPIEKLSIRKNILIACINRRGKIFMPRGNDNIQPGDNVIIVTTESGLKDLDDIAAK